MSRSSESAVHLLRRLIGPECKSPSCAFHDSRRTQATQDARLVVLRRIKVCRDRVVRIGQGRMACRAGTMATCGITETELVCAWHAEYVAPPAQHSMSLASAWIPYLHVVTRARSVNCARHFNELHRSVKSIEDISQED